MAAPPPVANFRITSTSYRDIGLAWDLYSPTNLINNFHLYVGLDSADRSNMISLGRTTSTYLLGTYPFGQGFLAPGTLYYITIVGHHNPNGNSPETQLSQSTVVLAAPTGLISPTQFQTSASTTWTQYPDWNKISRLNYYYNDFDPPTTVYLRSRETSSWTITPLVPNTKYYINLTAQISQTDPLPDYESPRATLELVTTASPPIGPIVFLPATASSITMSWINPVAPPTNILLAISTTPGVFTNTVTLAPGTASYTWTGLIPNTTYYFRIQNINQVNILTTSITGSMATVVVPPLESIIFSSITSSGFIANLTYDPVSPPQEIAYRINANVPPVGPYFDIASTPATLVFDSREEDTYYYLQVICKIDGVESTPLLAAVFTSNATPTNFTPVTAPTQSSILMGWDSSPSPTTGYNIWISTVDSEFNDPITLGDINQYNFTGLDAGTTYYFKLVDLGTIGPSEPAYSIGITAAVQNTNNYLLFIYKVTHGFKNSANSPQRGPRGPGLRQIRGGW